MISSLVPGYFLNRLRCLKHNLLEKNDFKVYYEKDYFKVIAKDFSFKSYDNPYYDVLVPLRGYLKEYQLRPGDAIIDGGAYTGHFSLMASKLVGAKGKVIAFEPDEDNYKTLLSNIKLNKAKNITAVKKGLWSKDDKLVFCSESSKGSSFCKDGRGSKGLKVPVTSIDSELRRRKVKKLDFVKMDIEGAEIKAVEGSKEIMKKSKPKMAIASYHVVDGKKTYIALEKLLKKLAYTAKTGFKRHLTTYAEAK